MQKKKYCRDRATLSVPDSLRGQISQRCSLIPDHLAGGSIEFNVDDNPTDAMLAGQYKFRTRYADWSPMEYIENVFEYDVDILTTAMEGGNE